MLNFYKVIYLYPKPMYMKRHRHNFTGYKIYQIA